VMAWVAGLSINRAFDLPKADTFGKIDAYAQITGQDGTIKTSTVPKDFNPVWNQQANLSFQTNAFQIQVFDYDSTSSDDLVGVADVELDRLTVGQPAVIPIKVVGGKKTGEARIEIVLLWRILGPDALTRRLEGAGAKVFRIIEGDRVTVFTPALMLHCPNVFIGIKYEKHGKGDVLVLETEDHPEKYLGLSGLETSRGETKLRRQTLKQIKMIGPGLAMKVETKIDDIMLHSVQALSILCSDSSQEYHDNFGAVTRGHGWQGALSYPAAKASLKDVRCDDKHQTIYFDEPLFVFKNDWDSDNADLAICMRADQAASGLVADIEHKSTSKRTLKFFAPPHDVIGQLIGHRASIDDLPLPCSHADIMLTVRRLSNTQVVPIHQILPLW